MVIEPSGERRGGVVGELDEGLAEHGDEIKVFVDVFGVYDHHYCI